MPTMRGDLSGLVYAAIADPANPSFLVFVGATLLAVGRVAAIRRRFPRLPFP